MPCHAPVRAILVFSVVLLRVFSLALLRTPASPLHHRSCVPTLIYMYEPRHERPHVHSHRAPRMPQATGRPTLSCPLLSPYFSLFPLHLLCLLVNLMGFPLKTCSHVLPSAVGRIKFWLCCTVFSHGPMRNVGFLGRWGTHACPQCLPSGTVPIRSWTRTLRPPGIRHRHLPCHTASLTL